MHSLETILCLLALLGCLGVLAEPILSHQSKLTQANSTIQSHYAALRCSVQLDYALSLFVQTESILCSTYQHAIHSVGNPFATQLGGDSNHYA